MSVSGAFPRGRTRRRLPPATTLSARATPSLDMPGYLVPSRDAYTGAAITRVSNTGVGYSTQYRRHQYPKIQPWNADGSKLFLGMSYAILNGETYAHEKEISNNCPSWPLWSETNPLLMYGTASGNIFQQFTLASEAKATIYTVSGASALSFGEGEGNFSIDGRYIALTPTISGHYWVYVYDMQAGNVASSFDLGTTQPDWVSMDQTGTYVVVNWKTDGTSRSQGMEVFSRAGAFLRQIYPNGEHGDLGISTAGDAVYVTMSEGATGNSIDMRRLADGAATAIWPGTDIYNGHLSCRNTLRPGWAYFSGNNTSNTDMPGQDEAFAIRLDGSQTVQRFGHMHRRNSASIEQFSPDAVPSRDGRRVLFASSWDQADSGSTVYGFIAELLVDDRVSPVGPVKAGLVRPGVAA